MKFDIRDSLRRLVVIIGLAVWAICYMILSLLGSAKADGWSLILSGTAMAIAYLFLSFTVRFHHNGRYRDIPQTIGASILLVVNAYVTAEKYSRNGFLYLTSERLICHFRDTQPYTQMAFHKNDNLKIVLSNPIRMLISDPRHTFEIVSTEALSLAGKMQENGWSVIVLPPEKE